MATIGFRPLVVLAAAALLASCGGSASPPTGSSSARPTPTACTATQTQVEPGDHAGSVASDDGFVQRYWVTVPSTYGRGAVPLYLLLAVGDGDPDVNLPAWKPWFAGVDGLLVVAGTERTDEGSPSSLAALLDQVESDYCVDPAQVHVIGASSSAYDAAQFACTSSGRVASFAASLGDFEPAACSRDGADGSTFGPPVRAVPVVAYTGADDRDATERSARTWAAANGCKAEPLVEDLGSGVTRTSYQGCRADVVLYTLSAMGHQFPMHTCTGPGSWICAPYTQVDSVELWTSFFSSHPLG